MRLSADQDSVSTDSEPGPSNGAYTPATNGFATNGSNGITKKLDKATSTVAKVSLPGTTLFDDNYVDREEFVRLVIQSLRDVGYAYVVDSLGYALRH